MRRAAVLFSAPAALLALAAVLALAPLASGGSGSDPSGVRGVVLDTTCPGPCSINDDPQPYAGENLRVIVRSVPDLEVVQRVKPEKGRFRIPLDPGLYRVRARVPGQCWEGEVKRVRVHAGEFTRVRLHVANVCVV